MSDYAIRQQPAPLPGEQVVLYPVIVRVANTELLSDLIARAEMGKVKYGRYLESWNGRSARIDLYQELLDALMYVTQIQIEMRWRLSVTYFLLSLLFWFLHRAAVFVRRLCVAEECDGRDSYC